MSFKAVLPCIYCVTLMAFLVNASPSMSGGKVTVKFLKITSTFFIFLPRAFGGNCCGRVKVNHIDYQMQINQEYDKTVVKRHIDDALFAFDINAVIGSLVESSHQEISKNEYLTGKNRLILLLENGYQEFIPFSRQ